jgi:AraC family transcriptional regulator of adaptative response / DNA-3-methyladenine glycosylase II
MDSSLQRTRDDDAAYRALLARDARLDGHLFVGVTSTGVYCRPICRVRTPRRENCRFFDTPAQAEAAAFRPCLKCRPEIAPGSGLAWSVMDASRTLARQATQWLDAHAGDGDGADGDAAVGVAALARRLGVSDRHLRRIFAAEHGVTPLQYLQTRRLLLAKQLLTDSDLPVSQVAFASGFRSLRRFNAAFAGNYRLSPTRLRRDAPDATPTERDGICATLAYREPFDRATLLRFLGQRAIAGVEHVDALRVRRSVRAGLWGAHAGWVEVEFMPSRPQVRLCFAPTLARRAGGLIAAVRRWLDLDADPLAIDAALAGLPGGAGLRLPGGFDAFELSVRAILGQQVTVAAARTLARRLVDRFGEPVATPWPEVQRAFPAPEALADAAGGAESIAAELGALGIIRSRGAAIVAVAHAWPEIAPLARPHAAPEPLIARLRAIPGVGPWTASYVAMRALGWVDAFPPGDVAVLNALGLPRGARAEREAEQRSQAWRPWRAYAVLKLWNSLEPTP